MIRRRMDNIAPCLPLRRGAFRNESTWRRREVGAAERPPESCTNWRNFRRFDRSGCCDHQHCHWLWAAFLPDPRSKERMIPELGADCSAEDVIRAFRSHQVVLVKDVARSVWPNPLPNNYLPHTSAVHSQSWALRWWKSGRINIQ
jgi:hypothetical protein